MLGLLSVDLDNSLCAICLNSANCQVRKSCLLCDKIVDGQFRCFISRQANRDHSENICAFIAPKSNPCWPRTALQSDRWRAEVSHSEKTSAPPLPPNPAHAGPGAKPKKGRGFHPLGGLAPSRRLYIILRLVLETSSRARSIARVLPRLKAGSWRSLQGEGGNQYGTIPNAIGHITFNNRIRFSNCDEQTS